MKSQFHVQTNLDVSSPIPLCAGSELFVTERKTKKLTVQYYYIVNYYYLPTIMIFTMAMVVTTEREAA